MGGSIERGRYLRGPQFVEADTVIIGSGASGSVAAAKLAEAGEEVVVLEEGGWVPPSDYEKMRPSQSLRKLWREGGLTAALGVGDAPVINVTMGRCVGGSSVLTGGVCFRTPDHVLEYWSRERHIPGVAPQDMEPYFEEVERRCHIDEVPEALRSRSTMLWGEGARKLGVELKPTRRNTLGCDGCGRCNFGCPHGAKMSVDKSYLPGALARGARVLSDCLVDEVLMEGDRAVGVSGRLLNGPQGARGDRVTARARKRVVLAAGAAHSPLVLMRSGLGRSSRQLGKNMTLHPAFRMTARFDEPVHGWRGALQSAYTDAYEHEGITLISVFVPPFAVASGVPGFGPEFMDRAGALDHLAMFGGMIHDEGVGRVLPTPGREPLMLYPMAKRDRAAIPTVVRRLGEAYLEAGARELYLPILGHDPVDADGFRRLDLGAIPANRFECSSQHPLGTCRMGASPRDSVVDHKGRVWGTLNLHVVCGAVLPTSLGVNPQQTVMAMATRLAERMVD